MKLGAYPFVRLLIPFICGILLHVYVLGNASAVLLNYVLVFLLAIILVLGVKLTADYKFNWLNGVLLNVLLVFFGIQFTELNTQINRDTHFSRYLNNSESTVVRILQPIKEKERSVAAKVEVIQVNNSRGVQSTTGKAIVYFQKNDSALKLKYGDEVIVYSPFTEVKPPQNPNEFDYKRYLSFNNINHQSYIKAGEWRLTGFNSGNIVFASAYNLRAYLLKKLQQEGFDGDEFGVVSALLLGYEDKLDRDIISAYSTTGALHVLSVSGLHVGLIFIVFKFLFRFFDRIKRGNIIKAIALLFVLWFYAFLTGLSPSVLRSTVMFSIIVLADSFGKNTNMFNTLALSCFTILLFDPYLIMNVGFQLSYCAVLGIVLFYQRIYVWFEFNSWLGDQIWKITCVSLAAQLATFPLGLLYFHQFPNYFLLSNLIIIPLSTVVMYVGLVYFLFLPFTFIAHWLAGALKYSVLFLNEIVRWFEQLPLALIDHISISVFETWLIYFAIAAICLFLLKQRYYWLVTSVSVLIVLTSVQLVEKYEQLNQRRIVVYSIPHSTAIDVIIGEKNYLLVDSALSNDEQRMLFHIKHNWWFNGLSQNTIIKLNDNYKDSTIFYEKGLCLVNTIKIMVLDKIFNCNAASKADIDYLVVHNASKKMLDKVYDSNNVKHLIYSGTFSERFADKIINKNIMGIPPPYFVSKSAYYEESLNQ